MIRFIQVWRCCRKSYRITGSCYALVSCCYSFFFSSRRRHTRYWRDWSSDVCSSDLQARSLGIQTVYQDLALVNKLSVFHNMFLNGEMTVGPFLNNRKMKEKTSQYLEDMGVNIPSINTEVARLSGGQRQAIAVARAVYSDAKMLLLDEPLAAMGAKEGALILDLIQRLKEERGIPMILIVHNYAQVFDVCDRVNLLRNGRIEYDKPVAESSVEELTELVVSEYRKARETGNGG